MILKIKIFLLFTILIVNNSNGQQPVPVGKGSYASYPPSEELESEWEGVTYYDNYNFVYNDPIYVSEGETRPIPTNDWWTSVLVEKYGGELFAYPLVPDPSENGLYVRYPTKFNDNGTDLQRGKGLLIKAENYTPDKAIAKDWSDWSVIIGMPDEDTNSNLNATVTHGIPFTHIEVENLNPIITAEAGASYFDADGNPLTFPVPAGGEFVISTEGSLFGIHLGGNATADLSGKQYFTIDLGSSYTLTSMNIIWETAFASGYSIEASTDNSNWTTLKTITGGDGAIDNHLLSNTARYVRILFQEKGSIYEYSIFEIEIFENETNVALNKTATATSTQDGYTPGLAIDGNSGTRWASAAGQAEKLTIRVDGTKSHFVVSALTQFSDLVLFENYAHNKPIDTKVEYSYDVNAGKINTTWNITTENLNGGAAGATIQGFIPHQYKNTTATNVSFMDKNYVTSRGSLKSAVGNSFSFSYDFGGLLPHFNRPYKNASGDANPYQADYLYNLVGNFASKTNSYGGDTYWGGKDIVEIAKHTVIAKELNHQSYDKLKNLLKEALEDWLTYTPGETEHYYARYERWKALVGFNEQFGSVQFTDHHFHYGYLIYAASLYSMLDDDFLNDYGDMLKLICKEYANWEREDDFLPYFRTFDPWIGHSYAGGTGSATGNNQESSSEAVGSWVGMFLLGEMLGDDAMRDAGAFGYRSESAATMEYWFDWDQENLPTAYEHDIVGILFNGGFVYGTYFSQESPNPAHIHGIQYLPINPGFKYLAQNKTWADKEYNDLLTESFDYRGFENESDFGKQWAHIALGFRLLSNPQYVTEFMDTNFDKGSSDADYIMDYSTSGLTYYYSHAMQNLGDFSFNYHTNFATSTVFEKGGNLRTVAYNPTNKEKTCIVYDSSGATVLSFNVPAKTLLTYPALPEIGQEPEICYNLSRTATASSGNDAIFAIDGNMGTRWIAESTDPATFDLDLGIKSSISKLEIIWETASASEYDVLVSNDKINWITAKVLTGLASGERTDVIDTTDLDYQYIRLELKTASTVYPFSIIEINVCGQVSKTLSTDSIEKQEFFSVYPNPVETNIIIKANNSAIVNSKINVYTTTGILVYSSIMDSNFKEINIEKLSCGIYFIKIEGYSEVFKILKK